MIPRPVNAQPQPIASKMLAMISEEIAAAMLRMNPAKATRLADWPGSHSVWKDVLVTKMIDIPIAARAVQKRTAAG